jgi:hypothetical protein
MEMRVRVTDRTNERCDVTVYERAAGGAVRILSSFHAGQCGRHSPLLLLAIFSVLFCFTEKNGRRGKKEKGEEHRNLWTRTSVSEHFLAEKHLVNNCAISALNKVTYFKETIFLGSTKPSLHFTKWGGDQLLKFRPLFQACFFQRSA